MKRKKFAVCMAELMACYPEYRTVDSNDWMVTVKAYYELINKAFGDKADEAIESAFESAVFVHDQFPSCGQLSALITARLRARDPKNNEAG